MSEHDCRHEAELAVLVSDMVSTKQTVQDIYKVLTGNGDGGLVTKMAVTQSSLSRVWYFLGGGTLLVLGIIVKRLLH